MSFTEEEKRQWRQEKQLREAERPRPRSEPIAECFHCGQTFGWNEGSPSGDWPICNICDKD